MATDVQPRLLKVLEERTFRRLGGTTVLRSNARVIVATHQPLGEAVANRQFRADLYYRLQVLTITLPPLRARVDEILPLARSFLPRGSSIHATAEPSLQAYAWPGNVRELRNTIWRAAILSDGTPIRSEHLGLFAREPSKTVLTASVSAAPSESLADVEREAIRRVLEATNGNRTRAAGRLGIARSTLLEKIKKHEL